jgi:Tfp pilus assembly protein PilF
MVQSRSGVTKRRPLQLLLVISILLAPARVAAGRVFKHLPEPGGDQVCNIQADFFLGIENYPATIRLHQQVIAHDPKNALAHYHLGFAYGMVGRRRGEISEYQQAVDLGLADWTLFLNLGLAYLEQTNPKSAADALKVAVLLAPKRQEPHYNLALAYERLGMLNDAEQEALAALALEPHDPEIRNTVALLLAERGDYVHAREEWSALLAHNPAYEPAKTNIAILDRTVRAESKRNVPEFASEDFDRAAMSATRFGGFH